jgi:hypothetical protein
MSAADQNHSRAAQLKCLSDPTVSLSVWIFRLRRPAPFVGLPLEQRNDS